MISRHLILAAWLLSGAACPQGPEKETDMQISAQPQNFEQFKQLVDTAHRAQPIEPGSLDQARQALAALPQAEQTRALDYLEKQIQQYGSDETKRLYSLNPELQLTPVLSILPPEQVPDWLRQRAGADPLINLDEYRQLEPARRQALLSLLQSAHDSYAALAEEMRSGRNHATEAKADLAAFLEQARAFEAGQPSS